MVPDQPENMNVEGSIKWMEQRVIGRHPGTVHLIKLFAWSHLPPDLRHVSRRFADLAMGVAVVLKDGPELTTGLRKLLEAKDCCVRQAVLDDQN
jgi:hypothetical protein